MTSAAPMIVALDPDSALMVVVVVSFFTLSVVLILRRVLDRPGGLASGLLLSLPLALPLLAAGLYRRSLVPEIAILEPATLAVLARSNGGLEDLLLLSDTKLDVVTPYVLAASVGPWLLALGAALSCLFLLRRLAGCMSIRRLLRRCRPLCDAGYPRVAEVIERLSCAAGLKGAPEVLVMPSGRPGVFAVAGRGGRILISDELIECLDDQELEATMAHELAHLKARDVRVLFWAGLLRDLAAWNPMAHLAFRRLAMDRELEADRCAAHLTGRPLAVASSLLKMCELMRGRREMRLASALGLWKGRGRVARRVSKLIAVSDGAVTSKPTSPMVFVAASALAAALALQVGVAMTSGDGASLAFVWGTPSSAAARVWSGGARRRGSSAPGKAATARYLTLPGASLAPVRERDLAKWVQVVTRVAAREGGFHRVGPQTRAAGGRALPLFLEPDIGPIKIYRMKLLPL